MSTSANAQFNLRADQCDAVQDCRVTYGDTATQCRGARNNRSVCVCGQQRCDRISPPASGPRPNPPASNPPPSGPTQPSSCRGRSDIGDPGWVLDDSRYDRRFPVIEEWVKAGVEGGIPCTGLPVRAQLNPGDNVQTAIDRVANAGGGVVLLRAGSWQINQSIIMRSGVVLRGQNRSATRLVVNLRAGNNRRRFAVNFDRIENAGVENLTFFFSVPGWQPYDLNDYGEPRFNNATSPYVNDRAVRIGETSRASSVFRSHGQDVNVGFVRFDDSRNSWVQNTTMEQSGSHPIVIDRGASHITVRNNLLSRCYQKGGGGYCYVDIKGDRNLIYKNTVRKIRHFAIQNGAQYNVVYDNDFEVDVNFHNGDDGFNLVENNRVKLPRHHWWRNFGTGVSRFGHSPPGRANLIYRNDVANERDSNLTGGNRNIVYHLTGYQSVQPLGQQNPRGGTFYPLRRRTR